MKPEKNRELFYLYKNIKTGNYEVTWAPPTTEKDSVLGFEALEYIGELPKGATIKVNKAFKEFSHDKIIEYLSSHENRLVKDYRILPLKTFLRKKKVEVFFGYGKGFEIKNLR